AAQTARGHRCFNVLLDVVPERGDDFLAALLALDDLAAVGLQHGVGVERVAVRGGEDARLLDVETERAQGVGRDAEQAVLIAGVDEDFAAATPRLRADADERLGGVAVRQDHLRMPGDLLGQVAQEVILPQVPPQILNRRRFDTLTAQYRRCLGLRLGDALPALDGIFQAAPQRMQRL